MTNNRIEKFADNMIEFKSIGEMPVILDKYLPSFPMGSLGLGFCVKFDIKANFDIKSVIEQEVVRFCNQTFNIIR